MKAVVKLLVGIKSLEGEIATIEKHLRGKDALASLKLILKLFVLRLNKLALSLVLLFLL